MGSEIDIRLARCSRCGELQPVTMEIGESPPVIIRWQFRKSEICDHLTVDSFEVRHRDDST